MQKNKSICSCFFVPIHLIKKFENLSPAYRNKSSNVYSPLGTFDTS